MGGSGGSTRGTAPPVDLHALVHSAPALIGRDKELARAADVLGRQTSALVLVVGETGMGKSAFLRRLETSAAGQGWAVARAGPAGPLTITPSTRPPEFARRLRQLLGLTAAGAALSAPLADVEAHADSDDPVATEVAPPETQGLFAKVVDTAKRWLREAAWLGATELVRDLQARAPVLIMIDGYCPNGAFEASLAGSLLPALTKSVEPVVVVVAEREEPVSRLLALDPEVIRLSPVDEDVIRGHLRTLTQGVTPAVTEKELVDYSRAAARRPEFVGSLIRLLSLQRPEG